MRIIRAAFWFSGAVILLAALVLVAHLSSNTIEFSRYNDGWNGTSQFFSGLDRHNTLEISDPQQLSAYTGDHLLLIIAPYRAPSSRETDAYRSFVERGNTILLVDDFGTGNAILENLGSRITILPGNLSSLDREYADPYSIVVYSATDDDLLNETPALVLNRAAPLSGGDPLVKTSVLSWIDSNGDGRINSQEELGIFPVMVSETRGKGRIVVLSDPSIFINAMQDLDDKWANRRLAENFYRYDTPLLIDQMNSRTRNAEGISEIIHVIRTTIPIELFIFGMLMVTAAWIWRKKLV